MSAFWDRRPVFVTGCTGLLGSWITEALMAQGANVIGLVRDAVPQSRLVRDGFLPSITVVRGAIEDEPLLERILNEYEVDTVFHTAAQTIVGTANRNPLSTFETNIKGTWNLLEACRRTPTVSRVIVASSDKAYGEQATLPYTEETPLTGTYPYDVSKSCADLLALSYARSFQLPVAVTRCANFFGGGDLNFNRIIPGTIRSVLLNEAPMIRSDGTYVRDYLYVADGAEAYLQLASAMDRPDVVGQAFNFGYGTQLTVSEIVRLILQLMAREDLEPRVLSQATNEIRAQCLSSEKARRLLGWAPRYTFEEGLRETIHWYQRFFTQDAVHAA